MRLHWRVRRLLSFFDWNGFKDGCVRRWHGTVAARRVRRKLFPRYQGVNLGCGSVRLPGYWNIDINIGSDLILDLSRGSLPFPDNSMKSVVCMSAINYFTRKRGAELIRETYRILAPGGVARFGVQDLRIIARRYLDRDRSFFFEQTSDGRERFEGVTMCDKVNAWFYGYETPGGTGKYVYDYETLELLFRQAGFGVIEQRDHGESRLTGAQTMDNRAEQMFFLEAVK